MVGFTENDPMTSNQKLIAGCVSGVMTRFITQPMDVIKLRAQLMRRAKRHNFMLRVFKKIVYEEGITAFFHGHTLGQVHSVLSVSSQFYVYEMTTSYAAKLTHVTETQRALMNFICGVMSGCVSTVLVTPLEVIRVRQVLVHDQYKGFIHGAKNVYKNGGAFAFYEGLSAALLQMGPQIGISFTTFRIVQRYILNFFSSESSAGKGGNVDKPEHLVVASTIAGSVAGFLSKTLTYPFDLVKRRLQIASHKPSAKYKAPRQVAQLAQCKNISECLMQAYKKEGYKGFFRGWTITIFKAQMTSVVAFTTYEMTCFLIREWYTH